MTHNELLHSIGQLKDVMIAVSTGGYPRISSMNMDYQTNWEDVDAELRNRGLPNPNPYDDLWKWYGRWSSGDLPSYQSRRQFIGDMYSVVITEIRNRAAGRPPTALDELTGWPKVDRTISEVRRRLAEATTEEQFQVVGLLCREALISLAQSVYDSSLHSSVDGVEPSETDAKRMLEAYLATALPGGSNEIARKHTRASVDLAVELQHRRTASFRQAALCAEATSSVVNVIAIMSGRRDPAAQHVGQRIE